MNVEEIIFHANELIRVALTIQEKDFAKFRGIHARVSDFLARVAGKNNAFLALISFDTMPVDKARAGQYLAEILRSYVAHIEAGLVSGLSPRRQAEIDVTSDFLEQARLLLGSNKVHPAAPTILIGATLEEFLRNWVEEKNLSISGKKPSIDAYCSTLREAELISKQDVKDIAAWAGIRNHAAHGEWSELGGVERIRLMLDGVNLFMRKYGA